MRSSGSTRNRRRSAPLRLFILLAGEDHPKACTGRRLIRWGRAYPFVHAGETPLSAVVLDPYAPTPLSGADGDAASRGGILAVDCSWNRLSARGTFPGFGGRARSERRHRRLPILVAANPQHYGRVAQLNTVEALSAALYLLGREGEAVHLLEGFAGGEQFLEVNRSRLDRYRTSETPGDVLAAEKELFGRS